MAGLTIVYDIELPEKQDADQFEAFLKDRYLPAVHRGPTRVGQVTSLTLWRGAAETDQPNHRFLLHMGFDGLPTGQLRIDNEDVRHAFEEFGARLGRVGAYTESAEA